MTRYRIELEERELLALLRVLGGASAVLRNLGRHMAGGGYDGKARGMGGALLAESDRLSGTVRRYVAGRVQVLDEQEPGS